jgi:predicted metal-dependent hydrolase
LAKQRRVLDHDRVLFGGDSFELVFIPSFSEDLALDKTSGEVVIRGPDRRTVKELIRRWFLKESSAYVVRKVKEFAPLLGVIPARVDVREITKWGYCTREGRLSFSWQLAALPERLREYIVVHELTHLIEFNHSSAFKKRLGGVCPDFRQRERELNLIVPYDKLGALR